MCAASFNHLVGGRKQLVRHGEAERPGSPEVDDAQRTSVSGRMIVMMLRTDGNHRYSWTKKKRSPFVR
jgi:hypothetical protein